MDRRTWNRLYVRCLAAMGNRPIAKREQTQLRWLAVMRRRTGKQWAFAPMEAIDAN